MGGLSVVELSEGGRSFYCIFCTFVSPHNSKTHAQKGFIMAWWRACASLLAVVRAGGALGEWRFAGVFGHAAAGHAKDTLANTLAPCFGGGLLWRAAFGGGLADADAFS
jgi:hypothetical protein